MIVAVPLHNHSIAGDEKSNDITAARKLAQLLRAGLIHPVHHSSQQRQELVQDTQNVKRSYKGHGKSRLEGQLGR